MDEKRFLKLWNNLISPCSATPAKSAWQEVTCHYSQKDRFYHTPDHISFCLKQLDTTKPLLSNPMAVEMALWFHDIVYIMDSATNEHDSADFFAALVGENPDCVPMIANVRELILDTTHDSQPSSQDGEYLADIDLSSLGRPWVEFAKDSLNVRRESPHLSDVDFMRGQTTFFEGLLAKPRVFYTNFFANRFEDQARYNLQKLLNESKG